MDFYKIKQLKYWKIISEEEEVIDYFAEEVMREEKHPWLEE